MKATTMIARVRPLAAALAALTLPFTLILAVGGVGCGTDEAAKKPEAEAPKRRTGPDEPWRKERPASGEAPAVVLPAFQSQVLKNGLTVIVAEKPGLPLVDVRLVVQAGSALEKPKEAGLAQVSYDMLDEGAADMDGAALSEAFAKLGTSLRVGTDREGGAVAVSVLERNLDPAVELLSKVVLDPTYDKDAFDKVVQRRLSALVGRKGDPQTQALETFARTAYGPEHPYGLPPVGTEQTLAAIKVKDAKAYWTKNVGPKNSALVFAGQITLERAVAIAEARFGKWKAKSGRPPVPSDPTAVSGTRLIIVKGAKSAPQTVMFFGRPLLPRGHEDEERVNVMNQILGGMFSSRLNMNLREDKRWTYGAWSQFDGRHGKGPWLAGASIKAEHTADAVKEILAELERMTKEPPTDEELRLAKANLVKSLPGKFDTVGALGGAASELFLYQLPLDYYGGLAARIESVTAEDVTRVAGMATAKEGLVGVLVGDAEAITDPVTALSVGEVQVIEPGGLPTR